MIEIRPANAPGDMDTVRALVGAFVGWLRQLYADDTRPIDAYFQAIQPELAGLPGAYGPPGGALLLALQGGEPVGMVALRRLDECTCEMKRMFVQPAWHGSGVGRALAQRLLEAGAGLGYTRMRLDTSHRQVAAQGLYRRLGFREIDPYYDVSDEMRPTLVFMECPLPAPAMPPTH